MRRRARLLVIAAIGSLTAGLIGPAAAMVPPDVGSASPDLGTAGPAADATATGDTTIGKRAAQEPDPVMNQAVFNDPLGSAAERFAIFAQLARLIDRVPAGEEIKMSWFDFVPPATDNSADQPDLTARLLAAHARGVSVRIIIDAGNPTPTRLVQALGTDDTRDSYIVTCQDQFPDAQKRGCIGTRAKEWTDSTVYAYNHNKFLIASRIERNDGTSVENVVFQASSNLTVWATREVFNNAITYSDARTYDAYRTYFEDLRQYRYDANGNNDYYRDSGTGTDYRVFFFPRRERAGEPFGDPATDTIYNTLGTVRSCHYDDNGVRRQTDIRIAMWSFNRPAIARRLADLREAGCWVDIVFTNANDSVLSELDVAGGPQLTRCNFGTAPEIDIRVHSKYMLIDGAYDDDIIPRTYTGSHNYAYSALRQADEALIRVMGRDYHDQYLRNFWHVRDTCRANGGAIR